MARDRRSMGKGFALRKIPLPQETGLVKDPILFVADFGEIARDGRFGNKSETVSVRQSRHHRPRSRSRDCDSGCVLDESTAHFVYRFVRRVPRDHSTPFDFKRVDDPLYLIHWPSNAGDTVVNRKGIVNAHVLGMKRSSS
jgi:hypothetical protein